MSFRSASSYRRERLVLARLVVLAGFFNGFTFAGTPNPSPGTQGKTASARIPVEGRKEFPFNFAWDIGSILTRKGCNGSQCHGGVKGQGGFKLSLDVFYPREDHGWIVEGGTFHVLKPDPGERRPRIDLEQPSQSLLLLKPTHSVSHGGGERFGIGSAEYQTILEWIRAGAPFGKESATVRRIEVSPPEIILEPGAVRQLRVTVHFSEGRRQDATRQVLYESLNPNVAIAEANGTLRGKAPGQTAVLIRAPGQMASVRVGVIGSTLEEYPHIPRRNLIDEHIFAWLEKLHIIPSALSSDSEFLRRVCLDLTGTLPPPKRVLEFLQSKDPRKRDHLIEILLNSPEYIDYWTFRFADLFRVALAPNGYFTRGSEAYWQWIWKSIAANKPYHLMARQRLSAQGFDGPSRHFLPNGEVVPLERIVSEEVRVFMGRRLDCAQCHDHPYESWSQDQFWGLAAFFGRLTHTGWTAMLDQVLYEDPAGHDPDYGEVKKSAKVIHPRSGEEVEPAFLDGTRIADDPETDLRRELALWMTSHPYFSEALVNRMWGYFFGRGMVDPVDDFRAANPPTHPELLRRLASEFRAQGYDLKSLIRLIVQSRAYQLSSRSNAAHHHAEANYCRFLPRPLDAEVLLDAISAVSKVPEVFPRETGGRAPLGSRAIHIREPDAHPSLFLDLYGRTHRVSVPERDVKASLGQALHRLVGSTYTEKLSGEGSRVDLLLKGGASDSQIVEELYLSALSRFPSPEERVILERKVQREVAPASRREVLTNLMWALVSSQEFVENH